MSIEDPGVLRETLIRSLETSGPRRIEDLLPERDNPLFEEVFTHLLVTEWKWLARAGRKIERQQYRKRFRNDLRLVDGLWQRAFGKTGRDVVRFVPADPKPISTPESKTSVEILEASNEATHDVPEALPQELPTSSLPTESAGEDSPSDEASLQDNASEPPPELVPQARSDPPFEEIELLDLESHTKALQHDGGLEEVTQELIASLEEPIPGHSGFDESDESTTFVPAPKEEPVEDPEMLLQDASVPPDHGIFDAPIAEDQHPKAMDHESVDPERAESPFRQGPNAAQRVDEARTLPRGPHFALEQEASPNPPPSVAPTEAIRCGRYELGEIIGRGGYGVVHRAYDTRLQRSVAIKIVHRQFVGNASDEAYLQEARMVASLDHPHIVPVYDVDRNESGDQFVVTKLIEGADLLQWRKSHAVKTKTAIQWVESIARALHHAHSKGLVHRDVKPANILIDHQERAYLTDFGIAIHDRDMQPGQSSVGTPAYMSPEQARGEGHRVDSRSDIYSLGTVLFELVAGVRPFQSKNELDLRILIGESEAPTLRSQVPNVSRELERVCGKALALRATDRYSTAAEFADDLTRLRERSAANDSLSIERPSGKSVDGNQPRVVVPKGLRSFDEHDSDFFLQLLPGSRDSDGLPDSIRIWKNRIESKGGTSSFSVGVVYGPSGCGKSSLIKAGLLPRLDPAIKTIYLEATAAGLEERLHKNLDQVIPTEFHMSLRELMSHYRRRKDSSDAKLLIVIDQFEQWLHPRDEYRSEELTAALRQCDGIKIQCLLLVRDDFWLATSRFLRELEIQIESQNSALVDLFDLEHAYKVLGLLGQAYGRLSEVMTDWTEDQKQFLHLALQDLATQGKIVPVRLALFAEMFKSKEWSVSALEAMGGAKGVGTAFFIETFDSRMAPSRLRKVRDAAQAALRALLPESGMEIKGHSRSVREMATAACLEVDSSDWKNLLTVLDQELHLIAPSQDSIGESEEAFGVQSIHGKQIRYQLTHDYLVPSLREWLSMTQRGTMRGRCEMILQDRSTMWGVKQEPRQLPALWEYLAIQFFTQPKHWTSVQAAMMRITTDVYARGFLAVLLLLLLLDFWAGGPVSQFHDKMLDPLVTGLWNQPNGTVSLQVFRILGLAVLLPYYIRTLMKMRRVSLITLVGVGLALGTYAYAMHYDDIVDYIWLKSGERVATTSLLIMMLFGWLVFLHGWLQDLIFGMRNRSTMAMLESQLPSKHDFWGSPSILAVLFGMGALSGWFYLDFFSLNSTLFEKSSLMVSSLMIVTWSLILVLSFLIYLFQRYVRRGFKRGIGAIYEGMLLVPLLMGFASFLLRYIDSLREFTMRTMGRAQEASSLSESQTALGMGDARFPWTAIGLFIVSIGLGAAIFAWAGKRRRRLVISPSETE